MKQVGREEFFIVRVGKAGLTEGLLKQINKHLKFRSIVKVKFLSSFMHDNDKKKVAQELADSVHAKIRQRVGFTVVLEKNVPQPPKTPKMNLPKMNLKTESESVEN